MGRTEIQEMSERVFYRRQFLNNEEEGGTAFIEAEISEIYPGEYGHLCADFVVADCNRVVELDFGASRTAESITNTRQKIKKFRCAVVAFEAALIVQLDEMERGL